MTDWNKFVKVFSLDVDVQVEKKITKADVILSLLSEGEIAFKGKSGAMFFMEVIELNKEFVINMILKEISRRESEKEKGK